MSPRIEPAMWSEGASPEAMVEAFGEAALTVAVLDALLEDPALRERAVAAMQPRDAGADVTR